MPRKLFGALTASNLSSTVAISSMVLSACVWSAEPQLAPEAAPLGQARLAVQERISQEPLDWVTAGSGFIFCGSGQSLMVLPEETPRLRRQVLRFDAPVSGAIILGAHAYLIEDGFGFQALDLDQHGATESAFVPLTEASPRFAVAGSTAFLGAETGLASVPLAASHVCCLNADGHDCGMDAFPPPSLSAVNILPPEIEISALASEGPRLYFSRPGDGIWMMDFALKPNERGPKRLLGESGPVLAMWALPGVLVLARGDEGVDLVENALADSPRLLGHLDVPCRSIVGEGRRLYLAGSQGLYSAIVLSPNATTWTVTVSNYVFTPSSVTAVQGDTVKWQWSLGSHTTTSGSCTAGCTSSGLWSAPISSFSPTFSRVFSDSPGLFRYFCIPHGDLFGMYASVNLVAPPSVNTVPYSTTPTRITTANQGVNASVSWDATNCASANYHILYGMGSGLASAMTSGSPISGSKCAIGTTGSYTWTAVPDPTADATRFLWFLVVGDNGATTEGSWGKTTAGAQEGGTAASGQCSCTAKNTGTTCGIN